jgi:hypothetical protein
MTKVVIRRAKEAPIERRVMAYGRDVLGLRSIKMKLQYDAGWTDRLWIMPFGRTLWMEFKKPGGPRTKLQAERHEYLASMGHDVVTVDTFEDAVAILEERMAP